MARNPSWSKQNRLSFFKILVGDLFFTRLRVPPAFLNNYLKRTKFPTESTIALKSDPKLLPWKVKMEKREGGHVYFTKGWKKVSKDMKLAIGDFLVFYLVGDAAFEIRAYDRTCCERISGWCPSSRSKTESGDDDDDGYGEEEEEDGEEASKKNKHEKLDFSNVRATQPGSGFASKHPFFQVNITTSSFLRGGMNVPWSFVKSNMNIECKHHILTLETGGPDWLSWPVKLIIFSSPHLRARVCGGLIAFLEENNVKAGDFCTFELVNKKNLVFRVSIYNRSG